MKNLIAVLLVSACSIAAAGNCPVDMKAIDAAISSSKIAAADMSRVKNLRAEGEKFHTDGKHADSMKALGEAKKILGI